MPARSQGAAVVIPRTVYCAQRRELQQSAPGGWAVREPQYEQADADNADDVRRQEQADIRRLGETNSYDQQNRLIATQNTAGGGQVQYSYDLAGNTGISGSSESVRVRFQAGRTVPAVLPA